MSTPKLPSTCWSGCLGRGYDLHVVKLNGYATAPAPSATQNARAPRRPGIRLTLRTRWPLAYSASARAPFASSPRLRGQCSPTVSGQGIGGAHILVSRKSHGLARPSTGRWSLASGSYFSYLTPGDELAAIIRSPREKELRGVMGESLGAITVANFYAKPESKGVRVPFFLDSLPNIHIGVGACIRFLGCHSLTVFDLSVNPAAEAHSKYAGTFSFLSGGRAVPSTLEVKVTA